MVIVPVPPRTEAGMLAIHFATSSKLAIGTSALADEDMFLTRHIVAAIAALATCVAAASGDGQPPGQALVVTCSNPASGATWQISIDYGRATVDANPARISPAQISWHDAKDGGNYTLDRASGDLTVVLASSTGGYFLHHRCALPP
jgi:hypothetical protein